MKYHTDFKPTCKCGAELKRLSTNVYPNFITIYYDCKQCGIRHSFKMKKDGSTVVITHGNPANMPMYETVKELEAMLPELVKEVFS